MSKAGTSQRLRRHLGTRLLHRFRHASSPLTPEGEALLHRDDTCDRCDHGGRVERSRRGRPSGSIAGGVPHRARPFPHPAAGESNPRAIPGKNGDRFAPPRFGDRYIDLVEEVGLIWRSASGLLKTVRSKRGAWSSAERLCVASSEYLAEHSAPTNPNDLRNLRIAFSTLSRPPAAPGRSEISTWWFVDAFSEFSGWHSQCGARWNWQYRLRTGLAV